jgi:hypothetical protein
MWRYWVMNAAAESEVKTGHLRKMEGAEQRLELVKADMMDLASLQAAVQDCQGVFHTACPVPPLITHPEVSYASLSLSHTHTHTASLPSKLDQLHLLALCALESV